jgi:hypothetical protein
MISVVIFACLSQANKAAFDELCTDEPVKLQLQIQIRVLFLPINYRPILTI